MKSFQTLTLNELAGSRRVEQQALHALEAGHVHEPHVKVVYQSPSKGVFDIFSGGGGGKSSGGKKPSSGGGGAHH